MCDAFLFSKEYEKAFKTALKELKLKEGNFK